MVDLHFIILFGGVYFLFMELNGFLTKVVLKLAFGLTEEGNGTEDEGEGATRITGNG